MEQERTCAVCGCTNFTACHDELRGNCWWVADHLCSHCAQPDARRGPALVAAQQLTEAAAVLLRFTREGDQAAFTPFDEDIGTRVAQALRTILQIEAMPVAGVIAPPDPDDDAAEMIAAIDRFIEGLV